MAAGASSHCARGLVDHLVDVSEPRGRVDIQVAVGHRRPWERRGQGTDRNGILSPGAIVSEVARRHDISPQHLSLGARRRGPARLACRPTRTAVRPGG